MTSLNRLQRTPRWRLGCALGVIGAGLLNRDVSWYRAPCSSQHHIRIGLRLQLRFWSVCCGWFCCLVARSSGWCSHRKQKPWSRSSPRCRLPLRSYIAPLCFERCGRAGVSSTCSESLLRCWSAREHSCSRSVLCYSSFRHLESHA